MPTTTTELKLHYIDAFRDGYCEIVWDQEEGERDIEDIIQEVKEEWQEQWRGNENDLKTYYVGGPQLTGYHDNGNEEDDYEQVWHHQIEHLRVDPEEPEKCSGKWVSPHSLLGGLEENPGVQGSGGGVVTTEVCPEYGWYKITNTWDQGCTGDGKPVESIEYREPDDESLEWLAHEMAVAVAEGLDGKELERYDSYPQREWVIEARVEDAHPSVVKVECFGGHNWGWLFEFEVDWWKIEESGRKQATQDAIDNLLGGDLLADLVEWYGKEVREKWKDVEICVGQKGSGKWKFCGDDPWNYEQVEYFKVECEVNDDTVVLRVKELELIFQYEFWEHEDDDAFFDGMVGDICEHLDEHGVPTAEDAA